MREMVCFYCDTTMMPPMPPPCWEPRNGLCCLKFYVQLQDFIFLVETRSWADCMEPDLRIQGLSIGKARMVRQHLATWSELVCRCCVPELIKAGAVAHGLRYSASASRPGIACGAVVPACLTDVNQLFQIR